MNVVASSVAFEQIQHDRAGQSHDVDALSRPDLDGAADDSQHLTRAPANPTRLVLLAAASGAISAAIVGTALFFLLPPRKVDDPRLFSLSRDLDEMKAQLQGAPDKLRELEVGAVASGETTDALRNTVKTGAASLVALRADLAALTEASRKTSEEQAGIAVPALLGVAVVQLRTAIDQGQPFDWELVNLQGISGRRQEATLEIARLAPFAEAGIPTAEQIATGLRTLLSIDERGPSSFASGLTALGRSFGAALSIQSPGMNAAQLLRAATRAGNGDYAQAARELRGVGPELANAARPVLVAMENRAIAQAATARLMAMARDGLATQLRAAQ